MEKKPKNTQGLKNETIQNTFSYMKERTEFFKNDIDSLHVSFSEGNRKTGKIMSVSLLPGIDCGNCASCLKLCYDIKVCTLYKSVVDSRVKNSLLAKNNSKKYFDEISYESRMCRAFRWHIGGDILNEDYLEGMIRVAQENPHCIFLAFTKMFKVVNNVRSKKEFPENLRIVFSYWGKMKVDNPFNFPTSHPVFYGGITTASNKAEKCNGNCEVCFKEKIGCWYMKSGDEVKFAIH